MTLRFVVASTGHSGSLYTSLVFTAAGIPTGHEACFTRDGFQEIPGLVGDSSAFALPHIDQGDWVVYHQVRHPLHAVRSIASPSAWQSRVKVGLSNGTTLEDVVRDVVEKNEAIEAIASRRWKVEELDAGLIGDVADELGLPRGRADKVHTIPKNINRHDPQPIDWGDLPPGEWSLKLIEMAERYGYDL